MTPQNLISIARRKNRVSALSILRACKRAEETDKPQRAKKFGKLFMVYPGEVNDLRDEYTPWLGKPRTAKSQSKKATYQRMYRKRVRAKNAPPTDPFFLECCQFAGVAHDSKEGLAIHLALTYCKQRRAELIPDPEAKKQNFRAELLAIDIVRKQPKTPTLENHAPEGTTLLQPYFEYTP